VPDDPVTFDDSEFPGGYPVVGQTYHYRLTVVNDTGDESDFSNEITYTITGHSVTGFTPASGAYGDQIIIDCEQIYDFDDTIDFVQFPSREGLLDAEIVSWDGATESITVTVPDFAITGQLRVIVNGLASLSQDNFVITSPYVLDINKEHVAEGDQVAILGANFGATQGASAVAFTGQEASPTLLWSNTLVAATVPPIDPLAVDTVVGVTVGGNLLGEFDLGLDPMITSPSSLTLTMSETATLNGRHFDTTGTLTVSGANVLTASWLKTEITAIVNNNWTEGDVVVATQWDSNAIPFTLDGAIFVGFPAGFDGTLVESGGSIPLAAFTNSNTERVEYYVDGALYFTDSNGVDGFDVEFIADDFTNERHTVTMRAYRRSRSMISAEAYFFSRVFDGDYNGDDVIDEVDLDALGAYLVELSIAGDYAAAQYPTRDGNRDGFIDEMDIAVIGYKYGETR